MSKGKLTETLVVLTNDEVILDPVLDRLLFVCFSGQKSVIILNSYLMIYNS